VGMDLEGAGGYFRWTNAAWLDVLELGQEFGWVPTGTGPPRGRLKSDCLGLYCGNDGQRFYARDARALADALERALAGISEGKSATPTNTGSAGDRLRRGRAGGVGATETRASRHPAVRPGRRRIHPEVHQVLPGWQLSHLLTRISRMTFLTSLCPLNSCMLNP
jgi:hypothetical protein